MLTIISMLNTIIDRLDMSADRIDGMYNRAEKYFQDLNTAFTRDIIQAEVERHRAMNAQREKENKDKGRCK
jgi:hypothetical protein